MHVCVCVKWVSGMVGAPTHGLLCVVFMRPKHLPWLSESDFQHPAMWAAIMLAIFIGGGGGSQRGALGFFNKPLMCFVMHWLYFTVKAILLLCQPVHFSPNCLFLQLPLVMLSTQLHRYHLFIFGETTNALPPLPKAPSQMYGMIPWSGHCKRKENTKSATSFIEKWWTEREREQSGKKKSTVSDSPLCETQFSLPLFFYLAPLWRPCLCGGRKNRSALFRLVSAIMKKRHQLKNGGSSRRLSQHSADNNYRLLSGDKRKSVEEERTRDGARSLARSPSPHYFTQIIFTPTSSWLQRIRNGFVLTLAVYASLEAGWTGTECNPDSSVWWTNRACRSNSPIKMIRFHRHIFDSKDSRCLTGPQTFPQMWLLVWINLHVSPYVSVPTCTNWLSLAVGVYRAALMRFARQQIQVNRILHIILEQLDRRRSACPCFRFTPNRNQRIYGGGVHKPFYIIALT